MCGWELFSIDPEQYHHTESVDRLIRYSASSSVFFSPHSIRASLQMIHRICIVVSVCSLCVSPQFSPLVMISGAPHAVIEVEGATNNPQRMLIDSGSLHSYVFSHRMMRNLPRAATRKPESIRGMRGSLITDSMLSRADESHVDFAGFAGLRLTSWTRKQFRLGDIVWNQKFAVADLPDSEIPHANPDQHGLIGASPTSRFTRDNPIYGFKPNINDQSTMGMFFEPISPDWCFNTYLYNAPLSSPIHWTIWAGKVETISKVPATSPNFILADPFELLIDSGTGYINLPTPLFSAYRDHLRSIIPSLNTTKVFMMTSVADLHLIPLFRITLANNGGPSLVIPLEKFVKCYRGRLCVIFVGQKHINPHWITLGQPLFQSFITVFDSLAQTIGFCEPVDSFSTEETLNTI